MLVVLALMLSARLALGSQAGPRYESSDGPPQSRLGPVRVTPPFPWARDLGADGRIPVVGDANGDAFADLLSIQARGKCWVDVALNGKGEKSLPPRRALGEFGADCIAATTAPVDDKPGDELVAVFRDGSVRLAWSLGARAEQGLWGWLSRRHVDKAWISVLPHADGADTLLIVYGDGAVETASWRFPDRVGTTAEMRRGRKTRTRLVPEPGELAVRAVKEAAAFRLRWRDSLGRIVDAALTDEGRPLRGCPTDEGTDAGYELARFMLDRAESSDSDLRNLGWAKPCTLLSGDINGDRVPDFIRFRRDGEPHAGSDVLVCLTYRTGDPDPDSDGLTNDQELAARSDPLRRDTDNDGLLDGWEVKGFHGTDLKALGCTPDHGDVLVRLQRVADLDEDRAHRDMQRAREYYARLPVLNRDGTTGIRLHVVFEPAVPLERAGRPWWAVGDEYFPEALRGAWHWMLAPNAGGGHSDMLADRGSAGGRALYATFLHEFGHQLGLDHEGFWPGGWCPAYPSLMNYAYSYQLGGHMDDVGYSRGRLAGLAFHEGDLSERLPLKYDDVAFLSGPPYRWRLKAAGDATLIDWNWNGVFGEEHVRADINYGYSTTGGRRHILMPEGRFDEQDRTGHAPFLVVHLKRLFLFYVEAPKDAKADETMTPEERKAAHPIPGPIVVRTYSGEGQWTPPARSSADTATGDPYVVSHLGRLWLFYPTEQGIRAQSLDARGKTAGASVLLPETAGASVSAVSLGKRLLLFLWRGPDRDATWREWTGSASGSEQSLGLRSTIPVGPCLDPLTGDLLLGCAQGQDEKRPSRWQVRRFTAGSSLTAKGFRWVMGEAGNARGTRRPTLLFETGPQAGKNGRLHFIAVTTVNEPTRKACYYDCTTIEDRSINDGWLQRRYYDEWTESASAAAACFYRGDIALASRWYGVANREFRDNGVYVADHGLGIQAEPMGDHDDISFIFRRGMAHSILYLSPRLQP